MSDTIATNLPNPGDRNTAMLEDMGLVEQNLTENTPDDVSDAGSVVDQNNLLENNLLPGEERELAQAQKDGSLSRENHNRDPSGSETIYTSKQVLVSSIDDWQSHIVSWSYFNDFDKSMAATRIDPIRVNGVDWLLRLAPTNKLGAGDVDQTVWEPLSWGGRPARSLTLKKQLLASIGDESAYLHDLYIDDVCNIPFAWPALGSSATPFKPAELRGRPSLKHYNSAVNPQILNKITQTLDPTTAKFWQTSFQLRNEADAMWIMRHRARGAAVGDNHLPLLVAAWQYYFDALAAITGDMVCARLGQRNLGYAYNIYKDAGWVSSVAEQNKEIVNCIGMPQEYATFWAMCCLPSQELYAARTHENGVVYTTPFGSWRRRLRTKMCVISEHTVVYPTTAPSWWANPGLILSFIEMYSMKFGLDAQVNDALFLTLQMPIASTIGTPLTVPEPVHSKDWFEGMVEVGEDMDAIKQLHMSSAAAVTAGWATAPCLMLAVLGEAAESDINNRLGVATNVNTVAAAIKQVGASLRRPGSFASTVLSKLLLMPTSAIELSGLNTSFVPTGSLVPPVLWNYERLALWQHQALPVLSAKGYIATGPKIGRVWFPKYKITPSHLVVDVNTYQLLRRFHLIEPQSEQSMTLSQFDTAPSNAPGDMALPLTDPILRQKLAQLLRYGLRLEMLETSMRDDFSEQSRDPAEAVELYNAWQYSGICPSVVEQRQQYGGRRPKLPTEDYGRPDVGQSTKYSVEKAIRQAEAAQLRQRQEIFARLSRKQQLDVQAQTVLVCHSALVNTGSPLDDDTAEFDNEQCGWVVLKQLAGSAVTISELKRRVAALIGREPTISAALPDRLSIDEMSAISSALALDVMLVEANPSSNTGQPWKILLVGDPDNARIATLQDEHWRLGHPVVTVSQNGDMSEVAQPPVASADLMVEKSAKAKELQYNLAIDDYNACRISRDQLIETHSVIFPQRVPPRSMQALELGQVVSKTSQQSDKCSCDHSVGIQEVISLRDQIWPHRNQTTAAKNNLTPQDLVKMIANSLQPHHGHKGLKCGVGERYGCLYAWLESHRGQATEFVTSVGAWIVTNTIGPKVWQWLWYESGLSTTDEDGWLAAAKVIHDKVRKNGLPPELDPSESDWSQSLYLQSLYGRGGVVVDWAAEFTNKASEPEPILAWTGSQYSSAYATDIIRGTVDTVIATAFPKAAPQRFEDFMDNAYEWLVSGSTAGMPSVLKNSPIRDMILHEHGLSPRPTKRSVMEAIPRSKVKAILLETSPKIVAKAHMKLNETGGKARAIYGVTMWHYIFSNWLMAPIEKHLNHNNIDINLSGPGMLSATIERVGRVEAGAVFNSYDYPDFNSMHSFKHMATIYESAKKHACATANATNKKSMDRSDVELIAKGYDWLIEAVYHQYVVHPDTGAIVQTLGGLYSGNRDTTLINTLLNIAYASVVDKSLENRYVNAGVVERLCHGDDIITVHKSLPGAMLWNDEAAACNLKGQESKLMIDHCHHEYLRIMGCTDGKLRGSLARCVATFVNGNWETDRIIGVWAKLQELASSLATWIRRGARYQTVQQMWNISRYRILTQQYKFASGDAVKVSIRQNGPMRSRPEPSYQGLKAYVSEPYIAKLSSELPLELRPTPKEARQLKRILQKSTYGTELPLSYQQTDLTQVTEGAIEAVKNLGSQMGRSYRLRYGQPLEAQGTAKADWQLRNRVKALHHLLSVLDIKSRQLSEVEVISAVTKASKATVTRVLEADAELSRSAKSTPRWHLTAELASTISELEWAIQSTTSRWEATLAGSEGAADKRVIDDINVITPTFNSIRLGETLLY